MLDECKTVPLYILSALLSSACYGSELNSAKGRARTCFIDAHWHIRYSCVYEAHISPTEAKHHMSSALNSMMC